MKRLFFCLVFALVVTFSFCSAADLDAVDTYSFDPVTMSALDYSVMPLDLSTDESKWLSGIYQTLVNNTYLNKDSIYGLLVDLRDFISGFNDDWPDLISDVESLRSRLVGTSNSVFTMISGISSQLTTASPAQTTLAGRVKLMYELLQLIQPDVDNMDLNLRQIYSDTDTLVTNSVSVLTYLSGIWGDTGEISDVLNSLFRIDYTNSAGNSSFMSFKPIKYLAFQTLHLTRNATDEFGIPTLYGRIQSIQEVLINSYRRNFTFWESGNSSFISLSPIGWLSHVGLHLSVNGTDHLGLRTLYSRIWQLQEVLASDDDLALAQGQKPNREEIEDEFFNPDKPTSLSPSDFTDLAGIGSDIGDLLSLDGNATITSFLSGLSSADSAGQGWFSESTRAELDAVSSSVSTYDLRDPDPYNMSGWEDRYYWLLGDDVNG